MTKEIKTLDILGMDYSVIKDSKIMMNSSEVHGTCYPSRCSIEINTDYSKEMQARTLIHELLHAIAWGMSKPDLYDDEETIDALTTGIYQVIKSNKLDLRKGI